MGVSAVSSEHGEGLFDPSVRLGAGEDKAGIETGKIQLDRALELVELIHK